MVRLLLSRWVLPAPVLLLLCAPVTAQTEEPFSGSGKSRTISIQVGDCFDYARYRAHGASTTLGAFKVAGHQHVDYCGIHPDIEGQVRFTTKNGDRLSLHYVGMRLDPTTYLCLMHATRGTGQFKGVTVDAALLIENYNPEHPFDFAFVGTIRYP